MLSGDIDGLTGEWQRSSRRWMLDVLVWNKAPLTIRTALIPVDHRAGQSRSSGELKRLGDNSGVVKLGSERSEVELAARVEHIAPISLPTTPLVSRRCLSWATYPSAHAASEG